MKAADLNGRAVPTLAPAISADVRRPLTRSNSAPPLLMPNPWADAYSNHATSYATRSPSDSHDEVLAATLFFDYKITNLEERVRTAMGPWALYGLRYSTLSGLAAATLIKVALVLTTGVFALAPVVGIGVFVAVVAGGIAVGMLSQTIARKRFAHDGKDKGFLQEIDGKCQQLLQNDVLTGMQVKQLRRLQILRQDIQGGFCHSLWSIFYGITGFDPELARMMRSAQHSPILAADVAKQQQKHVQKI